MSTKHKSGLHKEISSIFSGVPLPNSNDNANKQPLMDVEKTDKSAGHIPPMPSASPKPPQISLQEPAEKVTEVEETAVPVHKKVELSGFLKSLNQFWQMVKQKLLTPPEGVSPAKHMAMVISLPALFLVVVFVFGRLLLNSGVKGQKSQDDVKETSVAPRTEIEWQRPEVYPVGLRDPMKKSYTQTPATTEDQTPSSDIVVRGIVWSEDNPVAVIGTEIVYQGQTVHDVTIVKINKDNVEFEKNGKRWTQNVAN
jgi:hypothetical protein